VDDQIMAATQTRVEEGGGPQLLLGRRSYEGMLGTGNEDSPFREVDAEGGRLLAWYAR
jgi:hypothetical protein